MNLIVVLIEGKGIVKINVGDVSDIILVQNN